MFKQRLNAHSEMLAAFRIAAVGYCSNGIVFVTLSRFGFPSGQIRRNVTALYSLQPVYRAFVTILPELDIVAGIA